MTDREEPSRRGVWAVYDYPGGPLCFTTTDRSRIKDRPPQEIVRLEEVGIRVKPEPVAWRHGAIVSNEPLDAMNDTPLYEPEPEDA